MVRGTDHSTPHLHRFTQNDRCKHGSAVEKLSAVNFQLSIFIGGILRAQVVGHEIVDPVAQSHGGLAGEFFGPDHGHQMQIYVGALQLEQAYLSLLLRLTEHLLFLQLLVTALFQMVTSLRSRLRKVLLQMRCLVSQAIKSRWWRRLRIFMLVKT